MAIYEVESPLPGTFYRRPSPDAPFYVAPDGAVQAGDTIGLIEVMKQFTEIESPASGRVIEILVDDGEAVDAGQILIRIEE